MRLTLSLITFSALMGASASAQVRLNGLAMSAPHGVHCAREGEKCAFAGKATVYYGERDRWVSQVMTGPVACTNQTFGDPLVGTVKRCLIVPVGLKGRLTDAPAGAPCAREGGRCVFNGSATVSYGAGNRWVKKRLNGPVDCNNATFGDPVVGTGKACHLDGAQAVTAAAITVKPTLKGSLVARPEGVRCAAEGQRCAFGGAAQVFYGTGDRWVQRLMRGPVSCDNQTFGDPVVGRVKECRILPADLKGAFVTKADGRQCASENQRCDFVGSADVYYGAADRWVKKRMTGPVGCDNQTFGDPVVGTRKACFIGNVTDFRSIRRR